MEREKKSIFYILITTQLVAFIIAGTSKIKLENQLDNYNIEKSYIWTETEYEIHFELEKYLERVQTIYDTTMLQVISVISVYVLYSILYKLRDSAREKYKDDEENDLRKPLLNITKV